MFLIDWQSQEYDWWIKIRSLQAQYHRFIEKETKTKTSRTEQGHTRVPSISKLDLFQLDPSCFDLTSPELSELDLYLTFYLLDLCPTLNSPNLNLDSPVRSWLGTTSVVPIWIVLTWPVLTLPFPTWPVPTWPIPTWPVPTWPVPTSPIPTWPVPT